MANERYFRIGYGCGCGDSEDYIIAHSVEEAHDTAYQYAIDDYQSYEGLHGIRGMAEIAEEDFDVSLDEIDYDTSEWEEIESVYRDEVESSISYWAEEISHKEYLIGIGEIEDDED